jgi:hypothetical protein
MYDAGFTIFAIIVAVCLAGGIASSYIGEDDNAYEEAFEDTLQSQTGIDLDFSPSSPEKKK